MLKIKAGTTLDVRNAEALWPFLAPLPPRLDDLLADTGGTQAGPVRQQQRLRRNRHHHHHHINYTSPGAFSLECLVSAMFTKSNMPYVAMVRRPALDTSATSAGGRVDGFCAKMSLDTAPSSLYSWASTRTQLSRAGPDGTEL